MAAQVFTKTIFKWTNIATATADDDDDDDAATRVANSLLSQEVKLCFSDTKFTKAPYTKNILGFS